jgi:hypothetical protein
MNKKEFICIYLYCKKGKIGREGPAGPYGIKGASGQFCFNNFYLF